MRLQQFIREQFKQPNGLLGSVAGQIMAHRVSNIDRNAWLIELMHLKAQDKILEIGFGPGLAIEGALEKLTQGLVEGIDHSRIMLHQATKRNAQGIAKKRVRLWCADIVDLAIPAEKYDHIYSANVVQFWDNPVSVYAKIRKMLKPLGSVSTLYMPRFRGATSDDTYAFADHIVDWMDQAGFESISKKSKNFDGIDAVCVIGTTP